MIITLSIDRHLFRLNGKLDFLYRKICDLCNDLLHVIENILKRTTWKISNPKVEMINGIYVVTSRPPSQPKFVCKKKHSRIGIWYMSKEIIKQYYQKFANNWAIDVIPEQFGRDETCTICFERSVIMKFTVCGHIFCPGCIGYWVSLNKNCPMCRGELGVKFRDKAQCS